MGLANVCWEWQKQSVTCVCVSVEQTISKRLGVVYSDWKITVGQEKLILSLPIVIAVVNDITRNDMVPLMMLRLRCRSFPGKSLSIHHTVQTSPHAITIFLEPCRKTYVPVVSLRTERYKPGYNYGSAHNRKRFLPDDINRLVSQ